MDKGRLTKKTIGILALQGDYEAHRSAIADRMGLAAVLVRTPLHLDSVDALVIPGGESTAIAKLLDRIVAVRKDGLLATAFHPELTDDLQVHTIFAEMVESSSENR